MRLWARKTSSETIKTSQIGAEVSELGQCLRSGKGGYRYGSFCGDSIDLAPGWRWKEKEVWFSLAFWLQISIILHNFKYSQGHTKKLNNTNSKTSVFCLWLKSASSIHFQRTLFSKPPAARCGESHLAKVKPINKGQCCGGPCCNILS